MTQPSRNATCNTCRQSPHARPAAGQAMVEYLVVAVFGVMWLFWGGDQSIATQLAHALAGQYQAFSYAISFTPQ